MSLACKDLKACHCWPMDMLDAHSAVVGKPLGCCRRMRLVHGPPPGCGWPAAWHILPCPAWDVPCHWPDRQERHPGNSPHAWKGVFEFLAGTLWLRPVQVGSPSSDLLAAELGLRARGCGNCIMLEGRGLGPGSRRKPVHSFPCSCCGVCLAAGSRERPQARRRCRRALSLQLPVACGPSDDIRTNPPMIVAAPELKPRVRHAFHLDLHLDVCSVFV